MYIFKIFVHVTLKKIKLHSVLYDILPFLAATTALFLLKYSGMFTTFILTNGFVRVFLTSVTLETAQKLKQLLNSTEANIQVKKEAPRHNELFPTTEANKVKENFLLHTTGNCDFCLVL